MIVGSAARFIELLLKGLSNLEILVLAKWLVKFLACIKCMACFILLEKEIPN